MIGAIISGVASLAGEYFKSTTEKSKAKTGLKLAEIQAKTVIAHKVAQGEADAIRLQAEWENTMADATKGSFKDELALIVLLIPAVLVFIPSMQEHVQKSFDVLATLPDYYQNLLYIAISASFGIKSVSNFMKKK